MNSEQSKAEQVEQLLDTPDLAGALESEQFKKFLDQVPIAICVSQLAGDERIVYANPEFERLSGLTAAELGDQGWNALSGEGLGKQRERSFAAAVVETDCVGAFKTQRPSRAGHRRCHSNVIETTTDALPGWPGRCDRPITESTARLWNLICDKDALRELISQEHLQMSRAHSPRDAPATRRQDPRAAGRAGDGAPPSLRALSPDTEDENDLGRLSSARSPRQTSHAVEKTDMKVDTTGYQRAMPTDWSQAADQFTQASLASRDGGRSRTQRRRRRRLPVVVADDGIGRRPARPGHVKIKIADASGERTAFERAESERHPRDDHLQTFGDTAGSAADQVAAAAAVVPAVGRRAWLSGGSSTVFILCCGCRLTSPRPSSAPRSAERRLRGLRIHSDRVGHVGGRNHVSSSSPPLHQA